MVLEPTYLCLLCSVHLALIYLRTTDNVKCRIKIVKFLIFDLTLEGPCIIFLQYIYFPMRYTVLQH